MTDDTSNKLPRKKPRFRRWIFGAFLVLLVLFFYQLFGPNPPIIVSRDTTHITEPLRPDGLPDYEQYMLDLYRDGVTPENNAAVLLWQAIWPGELEPEDFAAVANELGLDRIPSMERTLRPLYGQEFRWAVLEWLADQGYAVEELGHDEVIQLAMDRPWTNEQFPPLADWLEAHTQAIDLIVKASHRPRYYSPSPSLLNQRHDMLIDMQLPGADGMRTAARVLAVRAMRHVGEHRPNEGWTDLLAIHRLARLTSHGQTLIEQLVAMAVNGIACEGTLALLASDHMTSDLATQIHDDLARMSGFAGVPNCLAHWERLQALDSIIHMKLYGIDVLSDSGPSLQIHRTSTSTDTVDWNVVLRGTNEWYDRLDAALRLPTHAARKQAYNRFDEDLAASAHRIKRPSSMVGAFFSRKTRSELIATITANLMLPAVAVATLAEDRTNSILRVTTLAAALTIYRVEHGDYPDTLDDLIPGVLAELPVDDYHNLPFVYRRTGDGYLLYNVGDNGIDDGGSNQRLDILQGRNLRNSSIDWLEADNLRQQIPTDADDIAIRVPRPKFELPGVSPAVDAP